MVAFRGGQTIPQEPQLPKKPQRTERSKQLTE
jgi:hypothetical protein